MSPSSPTDRRVMITADTESSRTVKEEEETSADLIPALVSCAEESSVLVYPRRSEVKYSLIFAVRSPVGGDVKAVRGDHEKQTPRARLLVSSPRSHLRASSL